MKKYVIDECYTTYASTRAIAVAENVINAMNNKEYDYLEDAISEEIDRDQIYYQDQWDLLQIYCTPQDANYKNAIDEFYNDIYNLIEEVEE